MEKTKEQMEETFSPLKRGECAYCGAQSHLIGSCDVYESHHDKGSLEAQADRAWAKGREEVLARRRAVAFGGPWERFLNKRTKAQQKVVDDYAKAEALRMKVLIDDVLVKIKRKPA